MPQGALTLTQHTVQDGGLDLSTVLAHFPVAVLVAP